MTSEEFAIKTAELCGYKTFSYEGAICISTPDGCYAGMSASVWNPEEDLTQAFEVLEATNISWSIDRQIIDNNPPKEEPKEENIYEVCLFDKMTQTIIEINKDDEFPKDMKQAICEAVKKWMEAKD